MKKKLSKISVLLVLMLTLAVCFAFGASAETDVYECGANGDNVIGTWDSETKELIISGEGAMSDENQPFAHWVDSYYYIKSIVIEEGITSIGDRAFSGLLLLETISIPETVTSIGNSAFSYCGMEEIIIPNKVTSIGENAFDGCKNLKSIVIPDGITTIYSDTFMDCTALETVTLGDSVETIEQLAFYNCSNLKSINLPDTLKYIDNYAFKYCSALENIVLPENLNSVYTDAFVGCSSLKSIIMPSDVYWHSSFENCTSLESVVFSERQSWIDEKWFYNCTNLKSVTVSDNMGHIGKNAFENCTSLENIELPPRMSEIEDNAFLNSGIKEIHIRGTEEQWAQVNIGTNPELDAATIHFIPNNINDVTCITPGFTTAATCETCTEWAAEIDYDSTHNYEYTNYDWENKLKTKVCTYCNDTVEEDIIIDDYYTYTVHSDGVSVTLNSVNEHIGSEVVIPSTVAGYTVKSVSAFRDNKNITKVTIPASVELYWSTFSGCDNLKTVIFEEGRTEIPESCLWLCESLETVEIPESVKVIGNSAFSGCGNLKSIDLPDGLTTIGSNAFAGCSSLENVVIPDTVTEIGSSAFSGCKKITEIELPSGLKRIEASTFSGTSLTSIVIPDSVEYIGDHAFLNLKLESIILPKNLKGIGEFVFQEAVFTEVEIPDSVTYMGRGAFGNCENLEKVNIPKGLTELSEYVFGYCNIKEIVIPDNITIIGDDAFLGNEFEAVTIPESVTTIGDQAFCNCEKLKSIYIPDTVESIGTGVFNGCYALESITVDENNQYYCNDEDGILYTKDKTVLLAYPFKLEKETFVVPSTVKTIEKWAIENQHLKNIVLPDGLVTIGENAISGCFESIALPGSLENIGYDPVGSLYLNKVIIGDGIATLPSSLNGSQLFPMDYVIEGMDLDFTDVEPKYLFMADYKVVGVTQKEFTDYYASIIADGDVTAEEEAAFEQYVTDHVEFYDEYIPVSTIYCHEGSTAEAYAIENGLKYELIHIYGKNEWVNDWDNLVRTRKCNHCDEVETEKMETTIDNSVEIVEPVDPETTFVVETVEDEASDNYILVTEALEAVEGPAEIEKIYDITLETSEGVAVQPDGSVQVKLPVEESHGNYKVFRVNDDGTYTDMNATVVDGYVVFVTDHFSLYVVVDTTEKTCEHEFDYTKSEANLTRPSQADGTWVDGYYTYTCSLCGETETEVAKRADYTEYYVVETRFAGIFLNEDIDVNIRQKLLDELQATEVGFEENFIESEQQTLDRFTAYLLACTERAEVCVAGTHYFTKYEEVTAPKCGVAGLEKSVCDYCGAEDEKEIPALKHSPLAAVKEKEVAPTCEAAGSYDSVVYCDLCGEEISRETVTVSAKGHSKVTVPGKAATCKATGLTDGVKCSVCGKILTAQKTIAKADHKDKNGDYKCDYGCGHEFERPTPDKCDHMCHQSGFMGFIWKIVQFFWKLFKMNPVCECGAAHY
ncbi:MAG: leucine-rich repeat protein [Clostridia bacterium]|nr:leucine-rich repeat protein [Clostridia bacterium]